MRFVVLTQYFPPETGASQVRLRALVRELQALGHEVEVVTAFPNHPTGKILEGYRNQLYMLDVTNGVRVHRTWIYPATGAGAARLLNFGSFALSSLYGLLRCERPDYVFIESPPLSLFLPGLIAGRLWGCRVLLNVADLWTESVRHLGLVSSKLVLRISEKYEYWSYKTADGVVAVTEGIYSHLLAKGVPESSLLRLFNGVDLDTFRPLPPDTGLAERLGIAGKRIILYAGTHGYAHGLDVALKAAVLLKGREDLLFLFVGSGSEKERLVELAEKRVIRNVCFLDPMPPKSIARLYSLASVGLSTLLDSPLFEGTRPAKIFASMACGVPVVYSGAGEGARLILESGSGVVSYPGDEFALSEAIEHLLDHPEEASRMGLNGRHYVEEHLDWRKLVASWVEELFQAQDDGTGKKTK